jgi:hypothetical protein
MSIEAMKQALEGVEEESVDMVRNAYETDWRHGIPTRKAQLDGLKHNVELHEQAITALRQALEQPADEIDWKDQYEKQKRRAEMWVAKYEKDIGPVEKAVPMQQPADEPVAWQLSPTDIYDFAGWLTTRKGVMTVGSSCEAGPMAEAVGEYLKTFPERFNTRPQPAADRAIELLKRCENEMRYAGWDKFETDNTARNGVYEQVKQYLEKNT